MQTRRAAEMPDQGSAPQFMTTNIEAILSAIERRSDEINVTKYETCDIMQDLQESAADVPALVKALRLALGWVENITEDEEDQLAAILSESQPQPIEPTK